jgi:predicted RNA-binding Zn ribbon-like protein
MTAPAIEDPGFLFLANHRALDFVNTEQILDGLPVDRIAGFADLARWAAAAGMIPSAAADAFIGTHADRAEAARVTAAARSLRAALRETAARAAKGRVPPPAIATAVNRALGHSRGRRRIELVRGRFEQRHLVDTAEPWALLGLLGEEAADLLTSADLRLIRRCESPRCILFFYDVSKNHARRWCSMRTCGNRAKAAAHRTRKKNAR